MVVFKTSFPDATWVETVTIDDMAKNERFDSVDLIKMDIEGAEMKSLCGGEIAIREFQSKLSISVYHKINDLWEIPHYIDSLGSEYRFSIGHFSIHTEDTVLFTC